MAMRWILLLLFSLVLLPGSSAATSHGKEFVTAFMQNLWQSHRVPKFELFLSGHHTGTTVTVSARESMFRKTVLVGVGQTVTVELPASVEMRGTSLFQAVLIQADKEISVISRNHRDHTTGATVVYPVEQLGTIYYVVTPEGEGSGTFKEFAVIAYQVPTRVDIHLTGAVKFKGQVYPAGSRLVADLEAFQAMQLQSSSDLSGTRVQSHEPVAVLSGHSCAFKFTSCDHVVEQLLPVSTWGTSFIVPPLSFQNRSDIVYVIASQNTRIRYQSDLTQRSRQVVAGHVVQFEMQAFQPLYFSADVGMQVLYFFTGARRGREEYDPFLINIPAITSYCNSYYIDGMEDFKGYAVIIAKTSEASQITSQKKAIGNVQWSPISGTEYSWGEQSLGKEETAFSIEHPNTPFGLLFLGVLDHDGYASTALCSRSHILMCPENSHHEFCGTACQAACSDLTAPLACKEPCMETCQCNEGYVLNIDKCVPIETCGGNAYKPGEECCAEENHDLLCKYNCSLGKGTCKPTLSRNNDTYARVNGIRGCDPSYPILSSHFPTCSVSGDNHYTTFDGKKYDFMGTCIYQLVGLCSDNPTLKPFTISVENQGNKKMPYIKILTLEAYHLNIVLSQDHPHRIKINEVLVNLPFYHEDKLKVFISGREAFIKTDFGLTVIFDWKSYVRVMVPSTFANALCGLCGNNNLDSNDDLIMKDGSQPNSISQFGESWKVAETPGCSVGCTSDSSECEEAQKQTYESEQYCGILIKRNGPFHQCHETIDPSLYFKYCVLDSCKYHGEQDILCNAVSVYVATCQAMDIQIGQWRLDSFCGPTCQLNSHYELCGNGCPITCHGLSPPKGCKASCKEGCYCNAGFVLSGDQCVPVDDCGCVHQGKYYKKGEEFYLSTSCQKQCHCSDNGLIKCCHSVKDGSCGVVTGSHFLTFDGQAYDFQGTCTYTLAKIDGKDSQALASFSVLVENGRSMTEKVVVSFHGYTTVLERAMKWRVKVNGERYTLPMNTSDGKLWANQEGNNIIVQSDFGLRVLYDPSSYVLVSVPSVYQGHVSGLCGNFNNNKTDDFTLPNGRSTQNILEFGASQKVPIDGVHCSDGCGDFCPICDTHKTAMYRSENSCGMIQAKSGPFRDCHSWVDPIHYFNFCLYDMCMANGTREALCWGIQAYVTACQAAGGGIGPWRTNTFCPLTCPSNSHYELCTRTCDFTCTSLSSPGQCTRKCFEGCQCDSGYLFDGDRCVTVKNCGCMHEGCYIKVGESIVLEGCSKYCTCYMMGQLICEENSCPEGNVCSFQNGVRSCSGQRSKCVLSPGEQLTSFNGCLGQKTGKCILTPEAQLTSFDGLSGKLHDPGSYEIASLCNENDSFWFKIIAVVQQCNKGDLASISMVHVFFQGVFLTVKRSKEVWVNGRQVPFLAKTKIFEDGSISFSHDGVVIDLASEVQVLFRSSGEVTVNVNGSLGGKLCASCGNFNGNSTDDLKLPNGKVAETIAEVISVWKAMDFCGCN